MLRLGLNREEKEMLSSTIKELQELRAELSVFKDALIGLKPEAQAVIDDGRAASGEDWSKKAEDIAEKVEEPSAENETEAAQAVPEVMPSNEQAGEAEGLGGEDFMVDNGPAGDADGLTEAAATAEKTGTTAKEEGSGVAAEEAQPGVAATGEEDQNCRKHASISKDWAVVNFRGRLRPWWKFWESKAGF